MGVHLSAVPCGAAEKLLHEAGAHESNIAVTNQSPSLVLVMVDSAANSVATGCCAGELRCTS
jgi:hypothetical protein